MGGAPGCNFVARGRFHRLRHNIGISGAVMKWPMERAPFYAHSISRRSAGGSKLDVVDPDDLDEGYRRAVENPHA